MKWVLMCVAVAVAALVPVSAAGDAVHAAKRQFQVGRFSGTTSQTDAKGQHLHMALKVNHGKRKLTVVFFELKAPPCSGAEGGLQYAGLSAKINRIGHFKADSPGDGFYGFVEGDLHRNKASGTAVYHVASRGCNSGTITWEAEHPR